MTLPPGRAIVSGRAGRWAGFLCLAYVLPVCVLGDVRDHTRPTEINTSTAVSESQAAELTLTLTEVARRPIQNWIRTAGSLDETGRIVTAFLRSTDAERVAVGQRVRSFPVTYRTQVREGTVTKVVKRDDGVSIQATLDDRKKYADRRYLLEIIVEEGPFLSIPNVSIIEDGEEHAVYVQQGTGQYVRRTIDIGRQGELYTRVLDGLAEGDEVVSIGSFFVDAEHKLKTAGSAMPGMNMSGTDMPMREHDDGGMDHADTPDAD